ncbi:MAG: ion transporter [Acidobacteriota bacterium]|nr:ion transporter [Acidobacteriota bacterium]
MSQKSELRETLHEIIFEADTPAGKVFDLVLIIMILFSVVVVMMDSVESYRNQHGGILLALEWFFTMVFTVEYITRLMIVRKPLAYAKSFFGLVDLMAILPTYLSLLFPGSHYLAVIRALRTIRIWRILKLAHHVNEMNHLILALRASFRKIVVFLLTVMIIVVIMGSTMYLVENEEAGFTSIPRSIYWAIVTITTVGYGDISPQTNLGQVLASMAMIMGYAIIAVPTGIVTVELGRTPLKKLTTQSCPDCTKEGHDPDAAFCKYCGGNLEL